MSIEKALADLTTTVAANTAALQALMNAGGGAKVTTAGSTTSGSATPGKGGTTAGKPAAGGKGTNKPKAVTPDDIRTAFGAYMSGTKDKDERETRKSNVAAIVNHFGADRATEIPEENRAAAMAYLKQFEAGETPDFMNEEESEGEGEDGGESLL